MRMGRSTDELDGFSRTRVYPDGTVIRVTIRRTDDEAYPSGWRYTLHYGSTDPTTPGTLNDGTIRRYDNAHEDTKGHELHAAPDPEPAAVDFPGILALWDRFWSDVPKSAAEFFPPTNDGDSEP